jgi:PPK2 family polyphosphate:nucleotide phosphotransferase
VNGVISDRSLPVGSNENPLCIFHSAYFWSAFLDFIRKLMVAPDKKIKLTQFDPADTLGHDDDHKTQDKLQKTIKRLDELQDLLYAEKKRALLIVLQGMDASGKDGTIRHVMSGVSPQGCTVTSFKVPNSEELAHDFLWRIHKAIPAKGMIGIFNRSHYEDVLVVRVHKLVPKVVWKARYAEINRFERNLEENDVKILKFFLHISREEQERRFQERLHDPRKKWKFSKADLKERKHWDDYVTAYEAALSRCSTEYAPWFIIPSDHKWLRNFAISRIIVETLEEFDMHFPKSPPAS